MTTTPAGSPPWVRTTAIVDYGGDANKKDYLDIGIINPKTDVSAAQLQRLANDVAAISRTTNAVTIGWTCNDTAPAVPTVTMVKGMAWNYTGAGYAGDTPPTGYPSAARNGNGDVTFTFASSYTDSYGVSGAFAIHAAAPSATSYGNYLCGYAIPTTTTIRLVITVANTGAATLDKSGTCAIW